MEYRLLEKTELWLSPIGLAGADLGACAEAVGRVLGLKPTEIMVTDVLDDRLTLDILVPTVQAEQIVGRAEAILEALSGVPGVSISSETMIHSDGVLGLVSLDQETGREVLERSTVLGAELAERIRRRCLIFPTGHEVLHGQIRDTNTPFLLDSLRSRGFQAVAGPALEDRADVIARAFRRAAEAGYGLVITTGGIGAEGKDQTLEALARVDPDACLPYILRFRIGHGRHAKDGVRIGVGQIEMTLICCLPGPNDEVRLTWPVLSQGVCSGWPKEILANALAETLRDKFSARGGCAPTEAQMNSVLHDPSGR